MSRIAAIHLNDARISALVAGGRVPVYAEPAFALLGDGRTITGLEAYAESRRHPRSVKNRYFYKLNIEPLADHRFPHLTPADLAAQQLDTVWRGLGNDASEVLFVVPGFFTPAGLGVLLGIANELDIPCAGIVDSAVAATRREYPSRQLAHIEIGLHATIVTLLEQNSGVQLDRTELSDSTGLDAMRSSWLKSVAEAFVTQCRFDPLHNADTEQLLLDRLDAWLAESLRKTKVRMTLDFDGMNHQAEMESITIIDAVSSHYQAIANTIRALTSAGLELAIQFSHEAPDLPGFTEFIAARTGGETFVLEPDAAARGALARSVEITAKGPRHYCTSLPWDQSSVAAPVKSAGDGSAAPTHLLYDDLAYTINSESLVIGAGDAGDHQRLSLAPGMAGVSQRHCSIQREGGRCVLSDHSRYGTYLNGNRISGSTVLQVGDVIRVGTPGVELRLIRVANANAA